jgi:hypothetical protein
METTPEKPPLELERCFSRFTLGTLRVRDGLSLFVVMKAGRREIVWFDLLVREANGPGEIASGASSLRVRLKFEPATTVIIANGDVC